VETIQSRAAAHLEHAARQRDPNVKEAFQPMTSEESHELPE
jgi:hypothetical protein